MTIFDRRAVILGPIDPSSTRGLEIGVLNNPVVLKSVGDVKYVDYASTDHLRKNQFSDTVRPEDICEVDIVWAEKPLAECVPEPVDYVIACHVIEHVPDVVGWLLDIHGAVKSGGIFGLVIPDKRYTFDILRPLSTVGQLIEAYLVKQRFPTIAQKFDFTSLYRKVDADEAWGRDISGDDLEPVSSSAVEYAYAQAKEILETSRYLDSHCWIFTPRSFLQACEMLARLKLFPYSIHTFSPTQKGHFEFIVHLRATTVDDPEIQASIMQALMETERYEDNSSAVALPQHQHETSVLMLLKKASQLFAEKVKYKLRSVVP